MSRNLLIGALAVAAVLVGAGSPAAAQESGVKVYTANVENVLTKTESCPGDWHELVHWIAGHSVPDLILLQQVDGPAQAKRFTERLNELHGAEDFTWTVAEDEPDGTGRCDGEKRHQTNAIVWNTVNLTLIDGTKQTWKSVHRGADPDTQCQPNPQSRTLNLKARFALGGGQTVTAASVHWPTVASGGANCYDDNARLTDGELKESGYASSTAQVVGGDMNVTDEKLWHRETLDVGFRDAMAGDPTWTHILDDGAGAKRRIDYVLAREGTSGPGSFHNPYTVSFDMAHRAQDEVDPGDGDPAGCDTYPRAPEKGCAYSEHRAVVAKVLVATATPASADAAAGCHGQGATNLFLRHGVHTVKVQEIGCRRTVRVLRRWAKDGYRGKGPAGWRCRGGPLNSQVDRFRCSRGDKRIRFHVGGG